MKKNNKDVWEMLTLFFQIGIAMIVCVGLGTMASYYVAQLLGAKWITVVGFAIGSVAGFTSVYKLTKKFIDRHYDDRNNPVI